MAALGTFIAYCMLEHVNRASMKHVLSRFCFCAKRPPLVETPMTEILQDSSCGDCWLVFQTVVTR